MLFSIFLSIVIASISCIVLVWVFVISVRSGQYDDVEAPKYRIMIDDDANPIEQEIINKAEQDSQSANNVTHNKNEQINEDNDVK